MITCKQLAQKIKDDVKAEVAKRDYEVSLSIITVGDDPASAAYVNGKIRDCEEVGIAYSHIKLPESLTQDELNMLVADTKASGVIVQLPLPKHLDVHKAIALAGSYKDVDGLGPFAIHTPCTALGIYEWLKYNMELAGKHAVIINRSELVGRPLAKLLLNADMAVTVLHSKVNPLVQEMIYMNADVVVTAVGKPNFLSANACYEHATIVDVGINRVNGKLCGDVNADGAYETQTITPVPGGVGLLTRACLMRNVLDAADRQHLKEVKRYAYRT